MKWIRLRLPANWEEQKRIHKMLRKEVRSLVDANVLNSFVMTYHVKERSSSLHLCLEIPMLTECSLEALQGINHIGNLLDIVKPYLTRKEGGLFDYFKENLDEQTRKLSQLAVGKTGISAEKLATRLIENASRGCKAALDILDNNLSLNLNPILLYDMVMEKCNPLNGGLWISDSAHFCFNSLGLSNEEEQAIRGCPPITSDDMMLGIATKAVKRLLNREGVFSATQ